MSLLEPWYAKLKAWPYLRITLVIAGLVVLLGAVLWFVDACDTYRTKRSDEKAKEEIANTVKEIANISNTIANLELQKAEKQGELNRDMEQLQENIFGLEKAKEESNQALANFQRAVNTNSNVNRSAEDLEEVLRRLGQ